MRKIALICRRSPSEWVSCRSITRNLIRSYQLGFPGAEISLFHMEESFTFIEFDDLAKRIQALEPDVIALIDHHPHPAELIRLLGRRLSSWPRLYIHVFGDFTIMANSWMSVEGELRAANPVFICASEKQQRLVSSFLNGTGGNVRWIPFPVDRSDYSFQPGGYDRWRSERSVPPSDTILLYTGRLSLQKNVLFLMRAFAGYLQFNPDAQLWLAGPIDDLGIPYIGKVPPQGLLAWDMVELRNSLLSPSLRHRIRYLGDQDDPRSLAELYSACDVFVSFSTHNDEDFGMSPAEAACCGTPMVLSGWGGYSSFARVLQNSVREVPVSLVSGRIQPDLNVSIKAMAAAGAELATEEQRRANSAEALAFCSSEAVGQRLFELGRETIGEPFSGYSERFYKLAQAYRISPKAPFRAADGYSNLFRELYEPYF